MTPEAQSKAARQRNELRAQAETIARLRREKMELTRDLRAAEAHNARAGLVPRWSSDMEAAPKDGWVPLLVAGYGTPRAAMWDSYAELWIDMRSGTHIRSQYVQAWYALPDDSDTAPPKGETE